MQRRWRRKSGKDVAEINITAFMNLMVILVPFLLITAVFSRITILELNLPAASDAEQPPEKPLMELEVIVRADGLEVGDRNGGLLQRIPNTDNGHDLVLLSDVLQQVKARYPEKTDANLLLEEDIAYEQMVAVMDTMRAVAKPQSDASVNVAVTPAAASETDTNVLQGELFPDISLGDAPPAKRAANAGQGGRG